MPAWPPRIDLLRLDIDTRIVSLWDEAAEVTEWTLDEVAAFMRAAYAQGYHDAHTEPRRYSLYTDHGYCTPKERTADARS